MRHKSELDSGLVVVAARRSEQAVYLDVLRDWSALGLVADLLFVDAEAERELQGSPCLVVSGGTVRPALLQAELARGSMARSAHVVCLSHVGEDFSSVGIERGLQLRHEVRDALPGAGVTGIHLIGVTRHADTTPVPAAEVAWLGAHNVVLAPENAQSPRAGVAPIVGGAASPVTHTHLVAGLCSAAGLWTADRRTPFHGEPDVAGERLVALRTYTRHLSARSVESRLTEHVMDVQRGYPAPMADGMLAQRLEDEAAAATGMADHLVAKHHYALGGTRQAPTTGEQRPVGFVPAAGMMLRFLGTAVTGDPAGWMDAQLDGAPRGMQALGAESAHLLTPAGIRGIRRDGSLASTDELDGDLGRLLGELGGQRGSVPPEHQDLTGLWKDFVDGGLTLLDGAKRTDGLEPVEVRGGLGVVTTPQVVAPAPLDAFEVVPDLTGYARTDRISPYDVDAARRTYELLGEQAAEHRQVAAPLGREQARLRDWFRDREATYTGRLGTRLQGELARTRAEIVDYGQQLAEAHGARVVPSGIAATQTTLAGLLLKVTGAVLLGLLVVIGLAALDVLPWLVAAPAVVLLVAGWLVGATVHFRRQQGPLFALLHRQEAVEQRLGTVVDNLAEALTDLRRLQRTYRQFLDWARVLGTFVQAPWGRHEARSDHEAVLGAGYPHNHRFGTAIADPDAVEQAASRLRPELFPVGWTSRPWRAFLADLPAMGADAHFLEDDPGLVWSDRAVATRSILTQWSEAVAGREWTGGFQQVLDQLHEALQRDVDAYRQRLLGRVSTLTIAGEPSTETYEEFMAGLMDDPAAGAFSRGLFTDLTETAEPWRVGDAQVTDTHDEFSSSLVLTQLSAGFTARDLAFVARRTAAPAATDHAPDRTPDHAPDRATSTSDRAPQV